MKKSLFFMFLACISQIAFADSFWDHNGSTMRLVANGNERQFVYEVPSKRMYNTGVRRGNVLFNGYKSGLCTRQKKQKSLLKQRHNSNFQDESDHAKL